MKIIGNRKKAPGLCHRLLGRFLNLILGADFGLSMVPSQNQLQNHGGFMPISEPILQNYFQASSTVDSSSIHHKNECQWAYQNIIAIRHHWTLK